MSRLAPLGAEGIGLAMTDLFISGAAALLCMLAVMRQTPDVPLPIQADIRAACPSVAAIEAGNTGLVLMPTGREPSGNPVMVRAPEDLAAAPATLGLPPRLFYTIALTPGETPLTATCLDWVQGDLIRPYNEDFGRNPSRDAARPVFGLDVAIPASGQEDIVR